MNINKLIKFLKCPYCIDSILSLENKKIICKRCNYTYDIIEEVPILIKKNKLHDQEKKQLLLFNKHYSEFSKDKYNPENWRLSMLHRIFDASFKSKVKTYLDIGCGATGYTVIDAAKKYNWLAFGVDISVEAMIRAKNLAKNLGLEDSTAFIVCSAESLPFKPNLFDYVSAISVLEHIADDRKVIKTVHNILNKNGYFYICVPNTYKRMWPFLWPIYGYYDVKVGHKRHYSIERLSAEMSRNNMFVLTKVFYNGHLIKFIQIILEKLNLINDKLWWDMENRDINKDQIGVQLNAIYQKK